MGIRWESTWESSGEMGIGVGFPGPEPVLVSPEPGFKLSRLWDSTTYRDRSDFPPHGRILAAQTKAVSVEESEAYVAKSYKGRLY
jgi:hypothetical protein